nr:LacI family DNA-binding transcriptional regulator [Propionicimonas sp.]
MSTINQKGLADHLGISRSLVSMALSDSPLVAEETKKRVLAAAAELGYVRDVSAASLAGGRAMAVGVLLPNLRNSFFEGILEPIERLAEVHGLLTLITHTGGTQDATSNYRERERRLVRRLRELRTAGLIAVTPASSARTLQEYARQLPTVVIGARRVGGLADTVHVDEPAAAALIVERALRRGSTRIASLGVWVTGRETIEYRNSCLEQAAAGRLEYSQLDSVEAAVALAGGAAPLTIAAHNDQIAINLITALRGAGVGVGDRVQVIGFDDTHLAEMPQFSLTSVNQNAQEMGAKAVQLLLDRLESPDRSAREVIVEPFLTIRNSG